ncbi:MAG: Arc family DNA-binding protein [Verrucomicrobia bacterium]|nr:Arc family DNA-binding protein [Verrucomicrobiota bacterium]
MASRKAFLLRMDPTLWQELETWAQTELRSVNGQIEYVLRQAVARRRNLDSDSLKKAGK